MIRPLVIAPQYLAANNTNGQLERLFFTHLPEDYEPLIVAKKEVEHPICNSVQKIKVVKGSNFITCIQSFAEHTGMFSSVSIPDRERLNWNPSVYTMLKKKALIKDVDYVHTISMPCSAHCIGYYLKRKHKMPWIAQFYDPWTDNGMRIIGDVKLRQIDFEYEKQVAEYADAIIVPDEALKKSLVSRYGDVITEKIYELPFVADTNQIHEKYKQFHKGLVISHIGGLNKNRNTLTFLRAISTIKKRTPSLLESFKVNYVGQITSEELTFIEKEGLKPYVNVVGQVSEEECVQFYIDSDLFLLVDVDCSPNLFYPSKIIKYFCYQKPIIGIVKPNSTLQAELDKTQNYTFEYYDSESLALFLERAIRDYLSICVNDTNYWQRFNVNKVIFQYRQIIEQVVLHTQIQL